MPRPPRLSPRRCAAMLLSLTIADFVLVEHLELALAPGFSVLTGETGAGKSILLDALTLLLGARAEGTVIRDGAPRAELSAAFTLEDAPDLPAWLEEMGLEGDGDTLLLRRILEAGGRSRAFINGRPATAQQLKEAGGRLLDIHGQHAHYSLIQPARQRDLLDRHAQALPLARDTALAYRDWREAARRRQEADARASADAGEREGLAWQVRELEELAFQPEQWQELLDEHRRLAHAADLLGGAQMVAQLLEQEGMGTLAQLHTAHGRLAELLQYDPRLTASAELLEACLIQAREAARELGHYAGRVELDPEALAQAEARIAQVTAAARKHKVTAEELPRILATCRERLAELETGADLEALARQERQAAARYRAHGEALSAARREASARLAERVTAAMQQLAMGGGRFEVALSACEPSADGLETVEFLVSPHPGQGLRPLAKTASGGELSRLGLALQTVLAGESAAGTLIFDEVDAGIGGGVAEIVGRLLGELGRHKQVLCVTHLPQVAACARHHWRVSKQLLAGRAVSRVEALDGEARIEEIARMLGGVNISTTTRQHALEMLGNMAECPSSAEAKPTVT